VNATLSFNRSTTLTRRTVTDRAGAFSQFGSGTTTLTADNTYSGTTTVSGGTLKDGIANALPTTTTLTVQIAGTFDLAGFNQTVEIGRASCRERGNVTDRGGAATITVNDAGDNSA